MLWDNPKPTRYTLAFNSTSWDPERSCWRLAIGPADIRVVGAREHVKGRIIQVHWKTAVQRDPDDIPRDMPHMDPENNEGPVFPQKCLLNGYNFTAKHGISLN